MRNQVINIPKPLWKLHGKRAYHADLIITYLLAILVTISNLVLSESLPVWKIAIIIFLSLDIGGGVVSNFTSSTIEYYKELNLSPYAFIWVHILQGLGLMSINWNLKWEILATTLFILVFSSFIISLKESSFRRPLSIFLLAVIVLASLTFAKLIVPVCLLLILMGIKLITGFAYHWKKHRI